MGAFDKASNSISHALGTDGSGGGLAGEISNLGKSISESPIANMVISAAGAYFGVPPSVTAALLGANAAGQKGDLMAGVRAGALSYGTGVATNAFIGTSDAGSVLGSSTAAPTTVEAATDAAATSDVTQAAKAVETLQGTVSETTGLGQGSSVMDTLSKAYNTVADGVSNVYDKVANGVGKVSDKIGGIINGTEAASGAEAAGAAAKSGGIIGTMQAHPMASLMALNAVGGAYTAQANREAAQKQLEQQRENQLADRAAYNASFDYLKNADNGIINTTAPKRADGSNLYNPDGTINIGPRPAPYKAGVK